MELREEDFLTLIEDEADCFSRLLLLLQKEKAAVIGSKLDELNESNKEKESLLLEIRILEEKRLRWMGSMAEKFGIPASEFTLSNLSQLVSEPYSVRLQNCASNLSALFQSIQEINKTNQALLVHSLDLVRGSLTLLGNLVTPNPVYYRTGNIQNYSHRGKVLSGKI